MSKKIVSLLVLVLFTFALAGCDLFGPGTTTTTQAPTTTTTTTITTTTTTSGTTVTTVTTQPSTTTTTGTTTSTLTTTQSTTITTTTTQNVNFQRELLLQMVNMMFGGELTLEEQETQVVFLLDMAGISSEYDLYQLLLGVQTLMQEFDSVSTLEEARALYQHAFTLGFTPNMITTIMTNVMMMMVEKEAEPVDNSYEAAEILRLQADIQTNQMQMMMIRPQVTDYCNNTATLNAVECLGYYDALINHLTIGRMYYSSWDMATENPMFDYERYSDMEWNYERVIYYTFIEDDAYNRNLYQEAYDALHNQLSVEEQQLYDPLLQQYYALKFHEYETLDSLMFVWGEQDANLDFVGEVVFNDYYMAYEDMFYHSVEMEWMIHEYERQMEERIQNQLMASLMFNYMQVEENQVKVHQAITTFFEVFDTVLTNIDQGTFDLIMSILMGNMVIDETTFTAENIAMYAGKLADLMTLFKSSITEAELDNLASLGKDLLEVFIATSDLTLIEQAQLLIKLQGAVDYYLPIIVSTYDDIILFLDSITVEKAQIVIDNIQYIGQEFVPQEMQVIAVSRIIDGVLGDGSFDVEALLHHLADVYFDVTTMFNPDSQTVLDVKAAITLNLTRIYELADIIQAYDPEIPLTGEQMLLVDEAISRVMAFAQMFKYGFEFILEPIEFGYDHQDFIDLIVQMEGDWMTEAEIEAEILLYMSVFETEVEEEAFYMVLTIFQMARFLPQISSFTEFQNWFGQVVNLGFSNSEIAHYIVNMLMAKDLGQVDEWLLEEEQYVMDQIAYYTGEAQYYNDLKEMINSAVLDEFLLLDLSLQPYAEEYWLVLLNELNYNQEKWNAYYSAQNYIGWWYLDEIIYVYENYQYYSSIEEFMEASYWESQYLQLTQDLDSYALDLLQGVFATEYQYETFMNDVYTPLLDAVYSDPLYENIIPIVDSYHNNYMNAYYEWLNQLNYLSNYTNQLTWIQEDILRDQITVDYFSDPLNQQLLEDVITIALDEITQLMMIADPLTFDDFFQFFFGMSKDVYAMRSEPTGPVLPEMTPEQVLSYMEDISSLLHVLFTTIDETDYLKLKTLLLDMIEMQFQNDGMTEQEIIDMMAIITPNVDKYWGMLNDMIEIMYTMMDGMTLAKMETIMFHMPIIMNDLGGIQKVDSIAAIIDALLTDGTFDYEGVIQNVFTVYFDIKYMFDYSELTKDELVQVYMSYINQVIVLAQDINTYDFANLTDIQYQNIFIAQAIVEYLIQSLDNPEMITPNLTFGYTHQDFVDLIYKMMGEDLTPFDVENQIQVFVMMFNLPEEFTYYRVISLASVISSMERVNSIQDLKNILYLIDNAGIDTEFLINYLVDVFIDNYTNNLEWNYEYQQYLEAVYMIQESENTLEQTQIDLISLQDELMTELLSVTDPGYHLQLMQLWETAIAYYETARNSSMYIAELQEDYLWDYDVFDMLMMYYFGDEFTPADHVAYNDYLMMFSGYEQYLYSQVIYTIENMMMIETIYVNAYDDAYNLSLLTPTDMINFAYYIDNMASEYDVLNYDNMTALMNLQMYGDQVGYLEENVRMILAVLQFVSQESNVDLLKDVALIVYDDFRNVLMTADEATIEFMISFVFGMKYYSEEEITPTMILSKIDQVNAVFGLFFLTYDETDIQTLNAFVDQFITSYIEVLGFEETEEAQMIGNITTVIDNHFANLFILKPIIITFLDQLTVEKIDTIMIEVQRLNQIGSEPTPDDQLITLDAMSTIIAVVFGDDSLSQDQLIQIVGGFVFDMQYALGYLDDSTTIEKVTLLQTAVNEILDQALLIYDYDFTILNEAQMLEVNDFRIMIEDFGALLQTLNGENMPV